MIKDRKALEEYREELRHDKYVNHRELRIGAIDRALKQINQKVDVPEYGEGVIVAFEVFKESWAEQRYMIKITNNTAKPILKSLFPDDTMAFWRREFTIIN